MTVALRLACDSADDTESLFRWLRDEPAVRAEGRLARAASDDPEDQGGLIDVLTLVLGSGLSAGQLALAILQWRHSRPARPVVTVTRTAPDGSVTRIQSTDPESFERALRELENGQP
jgi:membrane-associated two-gene conflict system component 1 (EACC1)